MDEVITEEPVGADAGSAAATGSPPRAVGRRRDDLAPKTLLLYAGDWARFAAFCAAASAPALPATPETVAAFLQVPGPERAARTRRLAAIDHRHRQLGFSPPGDNPAVRAALRAARKSAPRSHRPPPASATALRQAALRCPRDLAGMRDRVVLLLLAHGLSRRVTVGLLRERLRWHEDGVRLEPGVVVPRCAHHELCPARALEDWLVASATRYGPVLRKVTRWGTVEPTSLGTDAIRRILRRRLA